jgi:hypothetical protein
MNLFIVTKIFITALIITAITEISKKSVSVGGLVAAMPILTIIALLWFYYEKKDNIFMASFTKAVLAGFPMTIMFFLPTIYLFKKGYNFWLVLFVGILFLAIGAYIQQKIMGR